MMRISWTKKYMDGGTFPPSPWKGEKSMSIDVSQLADLIIIFGAALFVGRKVGLFIGFLMDAYLEKQYKDRKN